VFVTQAKLSDLKRGRVDLLALESLVGTLGAADLHVEVQVRKAA
jgi:predicted XRE-type DNA-binding protein